MTKPSWGAQLLNGVFCSAVVFLVLDSLQSHFHIFRPLENGATVQTLPAATASAGNSATLSSHTGKFLRFQVCNGFANQRLSLVYGLVLAAVTNRTVLLPDMIPSGVQYTTDNIVAKGTNSYSFEGVYDSKHLMATLASYGMQVQSHPDNYGYVPVSLDGIWDAAQLLRDVYWNEAHVSVNCPLFKVPVKIILEYENLIWSILGALRPSASFLPKVRTAVERLQALSTTGKYNFLHLRAEKDWVIHCKRWTSIRDGVVRNNCMNNTDTVDAVLKVKNFSVKHPLYIASYWPDVDDEVTSNIFARLKRAGYRVYTQSDILMEVHQLPREMFAMLEFYLGLQSDRFVGNSVSSFSAMLIYERRHAGLWASYYNGGNLPLAQMLPLDKLPWVFTYNSWSSSYDYMLKAALQSALRYGGLRPYCLFNGDTNSDIYNYLISNGVVIVQHSPSWASELVAKAKPFMAQNIRHSHLYGSGSTLVGTFQRVDIPILPELDQYDYVFFTDSDVFFTKRFTLHDFGLPLPKTLGMTYEMVDMFPYNAGIMLMNLAELRVTYHKFIAFILGNQQGMYFGEFGPGDQGAYNQFYENSVKAGKMSQDFNAKPYHVLRPEATVVHFHGPKPHHYLEYAETGVCKFQGLCKDGFKQALCTYLDEWFPNIRDDEQARRLYRVCKVMQLYRPLSTASSKQAAASYDFAAFSQP